MKMDIYLRLLDEFGMKPILITVGAGEGQSEFYFQTMV